LGDSSQLELKQVTQSSGNLLIDDLGELRKYHLISTAGETPKGGARLVIPTWIQLMKDLIRTKVHDPKRIESACARARRESPDTDIEISRWTYRVVALWRNGSVDDALEVAQQAAKKFQKHADIQCLLGSAYLRTNPPNARAADAALRKAYELKCQRVELLQLWIQAKKRLKDWIGILDITDLEMPNAFGEERTLMRAEAHSNLADIAGKSKDYVKASDYLWTGIREIETVLQTGHVVSNARQLVSMRGLLYQNLILMTDRSVSNPLDYIRIWKVTVRAFRRRSISHANLQHGIQRLREWWAAIERRGVRRDSLETLAEQIETVRQIIDWLRKDSAPDVNLINRVETALADLLTKSKIHAAAMQVEVSQGQ
ncbi:MAG TPA: hypothetical protein VFZ40_21375, partial [Pyrinomonadaceae bacterium]